MFLFPFRITESILVTRGGVRMQLHFSILNRISFVSAFFVSKDHLFSFLLTCNAERLVVTTGVRR